MGNVRNRIIVKLVSNIKAKANNNKAILRLIITT